MEPLSGEVIADLDGDGHRKVENGDAEEMPPILVYVPDNGLSFDCLLVALKSVQQEERVQCVEVL